MARILVIDDNQLNLKLFDAILKKAGHDVVLAEDGLDGVQKALKIVPELILMDVQMPIMGGIEALKILKESKSTKSIPVIAITSFAMKGDQEKMLSEGFDAYIAKPIDPRALMDVVAKILEVHHEQGGKETKDSDCRR
jgi:two-component system cell cycle response regulator DivK